MNPAMSFIMLSESQIDTTETGATISVGESQSGKSKGGQVPTKETLALSSQLELGNRLFEILSSRSDIDHPVCSECTDLLLQKLQQRQTSIDRECEVYSEYLKNAQHSIPTAEEQQKTIRSLQASQEAEELALKELEELEAEKAKVEEEMLALDRESTRLEKEEEAFWRERNAHDLALSKYIDQRTSLQNRLANDTKILESLQKTNVYNDTFCISYDGHFGTINGMRLGRLANHPVEWAEINAAWGETLLTLVVCAEKLGHAFKGYRLVPLGSTSRIERLEYPQNASQSSQAQNAKPKVTVFELFSTGDLPLGLGFLNRGFDNAMVCFLDCLKQLGEYVQRGQIALRPEEPLAALTPPHVIEKDKIGGISIKLGAFGQEEQWTKACKFTLTCCKHLLARASFVDDIH